MIEVEETESGLRIRDSSNNEVFVGARKWIPSKCFSNIERSDKSIRGLTDLLIFPADVFSIKEEDESSWKSFGSDNKPPDLKDQSYTIQIHCSIVIYVKFDGEARIKINGKENEFQLHFKDETYVNLGFRSRFRLPSKSLKIPKSPIGLAYAVTQTSKCFETSSADKSFPSLRSHPPILEISDNANVTNKKCKSHLNDILFEVPNSFEEIFVISTLAHYLQANVRVKDQGNVKLKVPIHDYTKEFSDQPKLEREANELLRKVFYMDCLIREFGTYSTNLVERKLVDEIGLDGEALYYQKPETRLIEYLMSDFDQISSDLPNWHLSMHVDPYPSSIEALPYLFDRMSAIYIPKSQEASKKEILQENLGDSFRSSKTISSDSWNRLQMPILGDARTHGWLSSDIPFDAFKATPDSFKNRIKNQQTVDNQSTSVVVVLNDPDMESEFADIYDIYSNGSGYSTIDVNIKTGLNKHDLREIIEENSTDFLHYIGHCDTDGLRCSDGNLSFSSVGHSKIESFFLNACGSYSEGLNLINKGSVVGAVTLRPILDEPAARVGTTFARLVINGFSFSKGLELAREQILMKKFYSVVGDGTHRLTNGEDPFPILLTIEQIDNDTFKLTSEIDEPKIPGASYQTKLKGKQEFRLLGNEMVDNLTRKELLEFLKKSKFTCDLPRPIILGGRSM